MLFIVSSAITERKYLTLMDEGKYNSIKSDVLQATYYIVSVWEKVTHKTVQSCLNKAKRNVTKLKNATADANDNEENDLLEFGANVSNFVFFFHDYVSFDEKVATCGLNFG